MKTTAFTIAAIAVLALGTVNLSKAATKNSSEVSTTLTGATKINKIEVHGNVELYVSDGSAEQVKIYNHYYAENALVQNNNGTLRISSYNNEKLVVWVTATDLRSISAYDNAEVKSFGTLSEIGLNVDLYNNASANLDLDGYSANINLNDKAKANLSGNVTECNVNYSTATTLNQSDFKADHLTENKRSEKKEVSLEMAEL